MSYLRDEQNDYTQHKSVNGIEYTLVYRPTDLLVNQELGDSFSEEKVEELRGKYSKYMYFNLSMSKNNQELLSTTPNNRKEFGEMVNKLVFGMGEEVHLFTKKKDTIELTDFIYPRMYGMGYSTSIMFIYPKDNEKLESDYLSFTVKDIGLGTGEVKFKIKTSIIKDNIKLSFNN